MCKQHELECDIAATRGAPSACPNEIKAGPTLAMAKAGFCMRWVI